MPEQPRHRHLRGAEFIDAHRRPVVHARQIAGTIALCGDAGTGGSTTKRSAVTCEKCHEAIAQRLAERKAPK